MDWYKFKINKMLKEILSLAVLLLLSNVGSTQTLSIGAEVGATLKSYNKISPVITETSNYYAHTPISHNEGWIINYYSPKEIVFTATVTNFFQGSGLKTNYAFEGRFSSRAVVIRPMEKTISLRIGKQFHIEESKFSIIPSLGLGLIYMDGGFIGVDPPDLLQLYDYNFGEIWAPSLQAGVNLGYQFKRNRISVQALGNFGMRYYVDYFYRINHPNTEAVDVTVSSKGDFLAAQLRYEYMFDLRKKNKRRK